jgi:hypothetical protein
MAYAEINNPDLHLGAYGGCLSKFSRRGAGLSLRPISIFGEAWGWFRGRSPAGASRTLSRPRYPDQAAETPSSAK